MSSLSDISLINSQKFEFKPDQQPLLLVMAAGTGSRLWPLSLPERPKQFVALLDEHESMLQLTLRRAATLVSPERMYVTVAPGMANLVREQYPALPANHIFELPAGRETLPGVAYAMAELEARHPGAAVVLFAADNYVADADGFAQAWRDIVAAAQQSDALVSLGIRPTYPAEQYGYMQLGTPTGLGPAAYWGLGYVEKPIREVAEAFVATGNYVWNSGIFAWRPQQFFSALVSARPETSPAVDAMRAAASASDVSALHAGCTALPNESLDHGLMERLSAPSQATTSPHVFVTGAFSWDDVGSYGSLRKYLPQDEAKNATRGDVLVARGQCNLVIASSGRSVRLEGVSDLIVVVGTGGEVLVAHRSAEKLLPQRQRTALHAGLAGLGAEPSLSTGDAQANSSDGPCRFVETSRSRVTGAPGHAVALVGVSDLEVHCVGLAVHVRPRGDAKTATGAPSAPAVRLLDGPSDVADAVAAQLVVDLQEALLTTLRPSVVLSAGATPRLVYRLLAQRYREAIDWRRIRLYQMDAFAGLQADDERAFHHQLKSQLEMPLGLSVTYLRGDETISQMHAYAEGLLRTGIDLVLHGVGRNGHLGFNEPGQAWSEPSGQVVLAAETRDDLAKAYPAAAVVPTHGVTLGLGVLNAARRVRVMVTGAHKRDAAAAGLCAPASVQSPLSSLQGHRNLIVFADRSAWPDAW